MTIVDRDTLLVNRLCQIHNDPHIRTFDGRIYDYMEVGEYVMYRNDKGPYIVNNDKNYKNNKYNAIWDFFLLNNIAASEDRYISQ